MVNITRDQHGRAFKSGDTGEVVEICGYNSTVNPPYYMVQLDQRRVTRADPHERKDIWEYNLVSLCPKKATNVLR